MLFLLSGDWSFFSLYENLIFSCQQNQSILDFTDCNFLFLVTYFMTHVTLQKKASKKQHGSITNKPIMKGASLAIRNRTQ